MSTVGARSSVALWHLARPAGALWVGTLPLVGFGLAHWDNAWNLVDGTGGLAIFAAWIALHTGTMWLNAALDRDEGEVLLGKSVLVPSTARPAGFAALGLAIGLAWLADPTAALLTACCASLSVAYSHPVLAWKGHPVLGPAVNILGYGVLSPWAGVVIVDPPITPRLVAGTLLLVPWVMGSYFAAQAFQRSEDDERGYRTLVVTHGPRAALLASRLSFGIGFGALVVMAAAGWFPRLLVLTAVPAFVLDRFLARWQTVPGGGDGTWAIGMVRRLILTGLTVLALALVQYGVDLAAGGPVSGRATALPAQPW